MNVEVDKKERRIHIYFGTAKLEKDTFKVVVTWIKNLEKSINKVYDAIEEMRKERDGRRNIR